MSVARSFPENSRNSGRWASRASTRYHSATRSNDAWTRPESAGTSSRRWNRIQRIDAPAEQWIRLERDGLAEVRGRLPVHVGEIVLAELPELVTLDEHGRATLANDGLARQRIAPGECPTVVAGEGAGQVTAAARDPTRDCEHVRALVRIQQFHRPGEEIHCWRQAGGKGPLHQIGEDIEFWPSRRRERERNGGDTINGPVGCQMPQGQGQGMREGHGLSEAS